MTYGFGVTSCGKWTAIRRSGDWHSAGQWLLGFMTAAGAYGAATLRHTDSDAMASWLDNYCAAHPLDTFAVAAVHLVDELAKPAP